MGKKQPAIVNAKCHVDEKPQQTERYGLYNLYKKSPGIIFHRAHKTTIANEVT